MTSFGADLRGDLAVGRLIGGLDEHGLTQFLSRWHGNLLDLVQLLRHARRQEGTRVSMFVCVSVALVTVIVQRRRLV